MNRRTFMEAATKSMACSGVAMLLTGRSLQQTELEKPEKHWVPQGRYSVWIWRVKTEYADHSWDELRDSFRMGDGRIFTRPYGADSNSLFTLTTVTPDCYPICIPEPVEPKGPLVWKRQYWAWEGAIDKTRGLDLTPI